MSSFGVVQIGEVLAMLASCAPGFTATATDHHYRIRWRDKTYPSLPLGEHGAKRKSLRAEVKVGDVRKMVRHLEIPLDCAIKQIPRLGQ